MAQEPLRFAVASDLDLEHTLIKEAWKGEEEVADVRYINGAWQVTFFAGNKQRELSWQELSTIYYAFADFIKEQNADIYGS